MKKVISMLITVSIVASLFAGLSFTNVNAEESVVLVEKTGWSYKVEETGSGNQHLRVIHADADVPVVDNHSSCAECVEFDGYTWTQTEKDDTYTDDITLPAGFGGSFAKETLLSATSATGVYYRKLFMVDNQYKVDSATINLIYDDGVIVYLNGKYAGAINIRGMYSDSFGVTNDPVSGVIDVNPELFLPGENELMIFNYNDRKGSSDIYFDCEVTGVLSNNISSECDIESFKIGTIEGVINGNAINVVVPAGVELKALYPLITISDRAKISPTGTQNFTNPVTYTVTAEDGTKKSYVVTVTNEKAADASDASIKSIVIRGKTLTKDNMNEIYHYPMKANEKLFKASDIKVTLNGSKASCKITAINSLASYGYFTVTVTSEDKTASIVTSVAARLPNKGFYYSANGKDKYYSQKGSTVMNTFIRVGKKLYYFTANGKMKRGTKIITATTFNKKGKKQKNKYKIVKDVVQVKKWIKAKGKKYYYARPKTGAFYKSQKVKIGGKTYKFNKKGLTKK